MDKFVGYPIVPIIKCTLSVFQAAGVNIHEPMVSTCGSGITAAIIAMAAHIALNKNIPVYDVSIHVI